MSKQWTHLGSTEAIRKRLRKLEVTGLLEDACSEADISYATESGDSLGGIIMEASVQRLGLYFVNDSWQDEVTDEHWSEDAERHAERMLQLA